MAFWDPRELVIEVPFVVLAVALWLAVETWWPDVGTAVTWGVLVGVGVIVPQLVVGYRKNRGGAD